MHQALSGQKDMKMKEMRPQLPRDATQLQDETDGKRIVGKPAEEVSRVGPPWGQGGAPHVPSTWEAD